MKFIWIKLLLMTLSLGGVFWLSRIITPAKVQAFFAAFGANPEVQTKNLCLSRISKITLPDGASIEERQDGVGGRGRWIAKHSGTEREVSYVEVEKWLASNCRPHIKQALPSASAQFASLGITFVDGTVESIQQGISETALFIIGSNTFESSGLERALSDLRKIISHPDSN